MTDQIKKQQGARLRVARKSAGFESARAAAEKFGWAPSSYSAHERGFRTIGQDDATRYAKAFSSYGAQVTAKFILFGSETEQFEESFPKKDENEASIFLKSLLEAVEGSYHMLGLDQEEAAALLKLVVEVAEEQPTPSAQDNFHRVQSEREVRKFLLSKRVQFRGA